MRRRISISFISLLVILSIILSGCANLAQKETSEPRVETAVQEHVDQENPAGTRAQDDFYEYVNGKIIEEKSREQENQGWDHFASLYDRVTDDLNIIAEELKSQADKFDKGSVEKAVADLFQTSLDFEGREKAGLGGLAPYLEAMESAQSVEEYLDVLAMIRKDLGKASLMTLVPSADPKDSSKYALFFDEPNLLMEKEDFDDELAVEDMKVYLASLLEAYGMEKQDAKEWGEKVFDLCKDFADATLSKVERSNVEQTTNYYTDEELQAALTNVDVKKFFASSAQDQYATKVIQDPAMIEKINAYLSGEHLELLKKYSLVSLLHDFAPYLNNEFVQASARFYLMDDEDPDMIAWDSVQSLAEFEIGDMYAKRFFSPEKKVAAEKMAQDILAGYKSHIDGLDWLSEESKSEAKKKIDSMSVNIGYPEEYPSFVIDTVKSLQEGGTFIENALAISKAKAADEVEKSTQPVDRQTWDLAPQTVNAFYEPTANQIVFTAAMLQEPFFNEKASYASNLGAIGAVIAHEIAHAFDDVGSLFDDQGNYRDWWTSEDREAFAERSKKFIEYFGSIEAVAGAKVDGELTLGENIADTSGISVISSMLGDDKEALKEMFTSYAASWASVITDEEIELQLESDEHAPAKVRVNGVLSTTDAFYQAFDVNPGDQMYLEPEKRVKMF